MYDAITVLYDAFTKMTRKKSDFFHPAGGGVSETGVKLNGTREVHCATGRDFTGSPVPLLLGEKIAKYIRKVRNHHHHNYYFLPTFFEQF